MSDRTERKLSMVSVGRYAYRHEAEFAAGFLEDAGIPYRLQIDDPSMGMSLSPSAILYVLGVDERRARDILDADPDPSDTPYAALDASSMDPLDASLIEGSEDSEVGHAFSSAAVGRGGEIAPASERASRRAPSAPRSAHRPVLPARQRWIALAGAVGLGALPIVLDGGAYTVIASLAAVALLLVTVTGRAPGPLEALLAALSGDAPGEPRRGPEA